MKKRFLSIVLAVLMLVGIMPISEIAADAEPPAAQTGVSTKTSENTTGPKLEKSAQWVDEKAGIAKITIQVTGEQPTETTKKTDIVLVIDRSLSMTQNDRDWLKNAKKAAKAFAKKVLTGDPNVRIAVVAYAAKTINDWDFSSKLATVENNIDAINTNNGNWHGTNIQAGIHSARERLKKSDKDADKFMIVLADGAPNCRFGIYSASETWRLTSQQAADHHIKTDYREGGKQYFPNLYTADSNTFSYNNSDIMDEDSGYCYTATVSEAYAAKATDGITCYAIGYGIASGSSLINALMYSISSTDAGFVNAGTDENAITKVFSDIATDIQYKAHDVTLTDTMGAGFTYLANETYPSNPVVTPSADNKTVTWNVADKLGDETKTLTFYVQYDKQNLTDAETLPTNTSASLSYKDNKENTQPNITVASPAIENLAKKVTYVDEDGNAYTDPAHQEKPHWYGDTVTLAPAPTKEGYTFNGWTTDDVTIGENDTFEMPKQNVTLKANYTPTAAPALTITKTAYRVSSDGSRGARLNDTDTVKSGDKIEYDLTVKNTGDVTLSSIEVRDDFQGKGTLYVDGEAKEADWKYLIGALHPDDDISYSGAGKITYTVTEADVAAGTIVNKATATVSYEGQEIKAEATHTLNAAEPTMDITITKIWDDSVPTDRQRTAKIWLYANGKQDKYFYASKGAGITSNTATGTIVDRPVKDADGKDIVYTVKETEINGQAVTSDNQLVTEDEIWTGAVTGNAVDGFTVTNSFQKNERRDAEVTKTATRTRGNAEPVPLPQTGGTVREGDIITYTVKVKNKGNVAFSAGDWARDYFTAAGTLVGEDGNIQGGGFGGIIGFSTLQPDQFIEKQYTYQVLAEDEEKGYIANVVGVQVSIPGSMNPLAKSVRHEVTVEKPHGVTYTFDGYDTLPEAVQNLLPTQDTNKKYYKGDSVTLPTLTENTKTIDGIKYTFAGWHVDGVKVTGSTYTMGDKDVTFVGKWTSVTEKQEFTVTYHVDGEKPDDSTLRIPGPDTVIEDEPYTVAQPLATTVNTKGTETGTWTFTGWCTDAACATEPVSSIEKITGNVNLYGKWTFEADEPADTKLTIAYYLMHADGTYPSEATDRATTDGKVGEDFTAEPMKTAYDDKGYVFDEDAEGNRIRGDLVLNPDGNVFKLYYKAVPGLEVTKTIKDVTRDGERLDPTDPEVEVKEGDVIEYEITVKNSGKLNLTDVVLTDEFTGAEGDLNIISGDDYTVDGYEITLKNDLNVGDRVTIKATYEVQLGDSGYEISNKAIGAAKDALGGDVTGKSERVTIRPDALKAFRIFGSVYKYVKSEKGTFNKDGETVPFEFKVTSDKKGEEILDTFTIDVSETVKAGETSEGDWGGFDFNLSEEEFENLDKKEFNGKEYPVVYLWELKGDLKNMSYSTKRITLYLDRPNISYYSAREPMVEYLGRWMAYADPDKGADADIINIYGKQSSSGGTVKVGPQLNRDDHVAYIMGYPDGTVQPKGEITRAEACTIFFRLLTDSSRDYYFSKTNDYTDVNAGDWFNNAISTLSNAGIVTGYNDGTFRPNQPITRGEMAKIIANFANLNKGTKSFTDLSGHWSKTYVELAAGNGWIAGYPDGSFRPDQKITRAETVTMINRVLERVPAKELRLLSRSIMLTFPDNNPGDWYYIAIQEASNSHEYQRSVYETTGDEMWTKLIDNVDWTKLEK